MSLKRPSLLESLVAQLPTPVSILKLSSRENKDFEYIYVNDTGVRFSGLERDFWIGKTTRKLSPSIYEGVGSLPEAMMQVIDTRNTVSLDAVGYVDDTIGPVISSFTIHYLEEDHIALVIKEVKKERELSEELSLQKQMLEMGEETTGSCSWVLDLVSEEVTVTPSFFKVFQAEKKDLNAQNPFLTVRDRIHHDDREGFIQFRKGLHDQYPVSLVYRYESQDQQWIWLKDTISRKCDHGILIGTTQDITESQERESRLKRTLHFLEKVMETTPEIVFILNVLTFEIIFENKRLCTELGYTVEEFEAFGQKPLHEIIHPDDLDKLNQNIAERQPFLQKGQMINFEVRLFSKKNNAYTFYEFTESLFEQDEKGNVITIIGVVRNVDAQKKAEFEVIQKNKELEQFAYVASHDLQEPLRTINNFTGLLEKNYAGKLDKNADTYLRFISEAGMRMTTLVKELLEYGRIGKRSELNTVDINLLLENVLEDLGARISETNATFDIEDLPILTGFEIELRLLLQNLISNAIKFHKPDTDPHIHVCAKKKNGFWILSFKDNGIGISSKYKEKIFVIFQRLHSSKYYEGTGIGLAHCQKIAELHGGKIWFDSELDVGTTFYISLPIT